MSIRSFSNLVALEITKHYLFGFEYKLTRLSNVMFWLSKTLNTNEGNQHWVFHIGQYGFQCFTSQSVYVYVCMAQSA